MSFNIGELWENQIQIWIINRDTEAKLMDIQESAKNTEGREKSATDKWVNPSAKAQNENKGMNRNLRGIKRKRRKKIEYS